MQVVLTTMYKTLLAAFGRQGWWPAETPFEVMVGAILTQNTAWRNVEQAIERLKKAGALTPEGLQKIPWRRLASLIRPAGYYNVKARRLKGFVEFLMGEYAGDINKMRQQPLGPLRERLLSVNGIGPETADSILLYACDKPIFVIDSYTKRVLSRHGLIEKGTGYAEVQRLFMKNLPPEVPLFQEYHALFVRLAKTFCRTKPRCTGCPLEQGWPISKKK